jgi:hypothetical protein
VCVCVCVCEAIGTAATPGLISIPCEEGHFPLHALRLRLLFFFLLVGWNFGYCGHYWPIVPAPGDSDGDCGEIGGMKIGRRNRSTRRKPASAPLCPPQIPHD